jgi:hypothetical protein
MVYGMGLAMLTIFVRIIFFVERGDVNALFSSAFWVIGIGLAVPALLNCRQGWKRIAAVCASSLYTSVLMAGMLFFLGGTIVSKWFDDAPQVQAFAVQDFDEFATHGSLSPAAMDATLKTQAELRDQLRALDGVRKTLDATSANVVSKGIADASVAQLQFQLKLQLLPDEQVERMRVTREHLSIVTGSDSAPATKAQLMAYRQTLHEKYRAWEWLLRTVHVIE